MKRWLKSVAVLAGLGAMLAGLVAGPPASATGVDAALARVYTAGRVQRDIAYSAGDPANKLDIHYPVTGDGPFPAVVYVHGGGWYSGDKADPDSEDLFLPLVARGYVVAAVNYRLAPRHPFPAQIDDIRCALRFLRANADRFGIDGQRVAAMGDSAGGHLVSLLGLTGGADDGLQAVVDLYGPADLTQQFKGQGLLLVNDVFGTDDIESPAVINASPVAHVTADAPQFLIIQGDKDDIVLPGQSVELCDRLLAAGGRAELLMVHDAGHAFAPQGGPISPDQDQIADRIASFLDAALR